MNNIELRCRAHNGYETVCHFGRWGTARVREEPEAYGPALGQSAMLSSGAITNSF